MQEMDFLTPDEREQMQSLMAKAAERMRQSKGAASNEPHHFLFLHCQCECRQRMERKEQIKDEFTQDVRTLLDQICSFCRKHGFPVCRRENTGDEEDELPLPF